MLRSTANRGDFQGKRRDRRTVRVGFAAVAAGAMRQPYRLMAEAAESGDYRNLLHATVATSRRCRTRQSRGAACCATAWLSTRRGGEGAGLAELGLASVVTKRSDTHNENRGQTSTRELTHWTQCASQSPSGRLSRLNPIAINSRRKWLDASGKACATSMYWCISRSKRADTSASSASLG